MYICCRIYIYITFMHLADAFIQSDFQKRAGLSASFCKWILNFLTGMPQVVRIGDRTSSTLITNTGTPQGCVLSPLLFSLFTHAKGKNHKSI